MYSILFLPFVISFVHSDDNIQIPNVADLPVFPGSVGNIGNLDEINGPAGGISNLGLVPITNIGSGPVGNIGQISNELINVGVGSVPVIGQQNIGQGVIGNIPTTSSQNNGGGGFNFNNGQGGFNQNNGQGGFNQNNGQGGFNQNNGQGGIGNLPITDPQNIGQGVIGNVPTTSSQNNGGGFNLNNGQAVVGNLPITGSQNNAQGGIGNLIITGSQNNGQGGIGNLPTIGSQNNGLGDGLGGLGNLLNINQTNLDSVLKLPNIGLGNNGLGDGLGGLGNLLNINQTNLDSELKLPNIGLRNDFIGIERPCQVFDIYCIRRYFKKNSKCKEVRGPVPEPYFRAQSSLQISRINATFSAFNVLYEGLNGRIREFYINRNTDKLVLSIEFRNVTFFSRDVYYRFYRRNREPITTYDYLYLNYKSYITTTIIPKIRDLQLYKSETNTFTNDAIPAFSIGPNAFSYPDSTVQLSRIELLKNLPIVVREAQLTEGPFSAATFIQNNICDFKLKVL